MCTVLDPDRVMVCDVSRDRVGDAVRAGLGAAAEIRVVRGEGTLFRCLDPARRAEFQGAVRTALDWPSWGPEGRGGGAPPGS